MKILITGATGFLGKSLSKKLKQLNHEIFEISSKTNNLTEQNSLNSLNRHKFDQIYHLAIWTQAGDFCLHHPGEQWIINQQINTNVLTWWCRYQPQAKMIAMGTSCSYDPNLPHIEENYLKGKPIDSLFTYAMTKRMLLTGLMALNKQYGLEYLYFIPSTLYGPGYHTDNRQLHFIFDLIRKILKAKNKNELVKLWGDGHQKRELVHVNDFIEMMLYFVKHRKNEILNIGAGKEYSIRDFAEKICDIVQFDSSKIQYDISKYVGAKSKVLIVDKLKKGLPHYEQISLDKGFQSTIEWFINNYKY